MFFDTYPIAAEWINENYGLVEELLALGKKRDEEALQEKAREAGLTVRLKGRKIVVEN